MRLSANNNVICFEDPKARKRNVVAGVFAYFGAREEVATVRVADIMYVIPTGDKVLLEGTTSSWLPPSSLESKNELTLLTLVAKSEGDVPRTMVIQLASKEDRNHVVSGIRMMINTNPIFQSQLVQSSSTPKVPKPTVVAAPKMISPDIKQKASSPTIHRPTRRLTKRDEVLEQTKLRGGIDETRSPEGKVNSYNEKAGENFAHAADSDSVNSAAALVRQQATAAAILGTTMTSAEMHLTSLLQDERINSEKMRTQCLIFQNELHERDEEIATLKKNESVLEQAIGAKQKMYDQVVAVQMQISKKLESVLLDKEEAQEINDALQEEIMNLKHRMMSSNIALPPPPILTSIEGRGTL